MSRIKRCLTPPVVGEYLSISPLLRGIPTHKKHPSVPVTSASLAWVVFRLHKDERVGLEFYLCRRTLGL